LFIEERPLIPISRARWRRSFLDQSSQQPPRPPRLATEWREVPAAAFAVLADFSALL
jgi:hypothetical protein